MDDLKLLGGLLVFMWLLVVSPSFRAATVITALIVAGVAGSFVWMSLRVTWPAAQASAPPCNPGPPYSPTECGMFADLVPPPCSPAQQ